MEFVVYILHSEKFDKIYIGFTSDLINRFHSHNTFSKKGFTIRYRPWKVTYIEFFQSKKEALEREKFLKTGVGRDWLKSNNFI